MPKETRTSEEIDLIKKKIITEAIKMIGESGFSSLSMRKLASRINMTAANIYNYFGSKDELYLLIQTYGFENLYKRFVNAKNQELSPYENLKNLIWEYIYFGTENPHLYNIIFSMDTPKYADYIDTEYKDIASHEKAAGIKIITYTLSIIEEFMNQNNIKNEDPLFQIIQIWTHLHGIVSLINSRVLREVDDNVEDIIKKIIDEYFSKYLLMSK